MKKVIFLFALSILFSINLLAVPAYPHPILVTQSDGSQITIRIYGDEWFNYKTTDDGYLIKQNSKGDYEYAKFENNRILSTGLMVRENRTYEEKAFLRTIGKNPISERQAMIQSLTRKKMLHTAEPEMYRALNPNPLRGQKKGLVILVEFADKSYVSSTARQDFTNLLNQQGYSANGGTGSAKDYFKACTFNQFDPTFDVYGPYKLSGNVATYGENGPSGHGDVGATDMVREACRLADGDVNFADYDTDNDGYVDMVFIYYAGVNEAEGGPANTIWPHKFEIRPSTTHDGKLVQVYACTSERNGRGTMCGVGTFCHEFGHVMGLPDTYNTVTSGAYTVGDWDIMAAGGYNNGGRTPPTWMAHHKFFLSYITPTLLSSVGEKKLPPVITSNKTFILSPPNDNHNLSGTSPAPNYFYLIENRQYLGWDSVSKSSTGGRLGKGLLITKINFSSSSWANNTPNNDPTNLRVDVIEADGSNYSYEGDTYPGSANITEFKPKRSDGTNYDGILTSISIMEGDSIAFCFRECLNKARFIITAPKTTFRTIVGEEPDKAVFKVEGVKFENNARLNFTGPKASLFQMRKVGETNWVSTILLEPNATDSTIVADIEVRYNPTVPSYKQQDKATFIARDITGTPKKEIELIATSAKKIVVVPPVLEAFTDTTSYSAVANWKKVDGAVGYYISVYQKNGSTTEKETFSSFATGLSSGWNQTFYTTSTSALPSAPSAVLFTNNLDTLWSPYYPQPISQIKFWLRNEDTKQSGNIFIHALGNNGWEQIASIKMEITLDTKTFKYDLDINKNYKRIRLSCIDLGKGIVIDDLEVSYAANSAKQRMYVDGSDAVSAKVEGLNHSTVYYAKIQATDKDPQGNYDNVTDFSNEIEVKTLVGVSSNARIMPVSFDENGDVIVYFRSEEDKKLDLYVYTLSGVLLQQYKKENYEGSSVVVKGLPRGATYVISLGAKRKGKFAKVYVTDKIK